MDAIVTRTTISFYCEDCAHANVKPIDFAGTKSICDGCKRILRIPGAKLQRPSERLAQASGSSRRLRRSSESGRSSSKSSRSSSKSGRSRSESGRRNYLEESGEFAEESGEQPRAGLLTRLAACFRFRRAS